MRPLGRPVIETVTDELNPPLTVTVAVTLVVPPGAREAVEGALSWKAGVGAEVPPPQLFTSRLASTEPRPVARS